MRAERDLGGDARTPPTVRFPAVSHGHGDPSDAARLGRANENAHVEQDGRRHVQSSQGPASNDAVAVHRRLDREAAGPHASRDAEPGGPARARGLQGHRERKTLDPGAERHRARRALANQSRDDALRDVGSPGSHPGKLQAEATAEPRRFDAICGEPGHSIERGAGGSHVESRRWTRVPGSAVLQKIEREVHRRRPESLRCRLPEVERCERRQRMRDGDGGKRRDPRGRAATPNQGSAPAAETATGMTESRGPRSASATARAAIT